MEASEIDGGQENYVMGEQTVIREGKQEKLPEFKLPAGEKLYVSRAELTELNDKYFQAISDLNRGGKFAPAQLRSVMESVVCIAYGEEIEDIRRKNRLDKEIEYKRREALTETLLPWAKRKWFRWKRNETQILLDELVGRQAAEYLRRMSDGLPVTETSEPLPFAVIIDNLYCVLPRIRKKRRKIVNELIDELCDEYNNKVSESKRLAEDLKEALRAKEGAEERARNAEEMLEEFLKESTPAPDETATVEIEPAEEPKTPAEAEPTEEPRAEGEEASETEKAEESESLSYDGLEGMDEQG